MQQLAAELEGLELQVAAVHPKVAMEAQRVGDAAQLAVVVAGIKWDYDKCLAGVQMAGGQDSRRQQHLFVIPNDQLAIRKLR